MCDFVVCFLVIVLLSHHLLVYCSPSYADASTCFTPYPVCCFFPPFNFACDSIALQMADLRERLSHAEQHRADLQDEIDQVREELKLAIAAKAEAEAELRDHKKDTDEVLLEVDEEHKAALEAKDLERIVKVGELETALTALTTKAEALEAEVQVLRARADRQHSELTLLREEREANAVRLAEQEARLKNLEEAAVEQDAVARVEQRKTLQMVAELKEQLRREAVAKEDLAIQLKLIKSGVSDLDEHTESKSNDDTDGRSTNNGDGSNSTNNNSAGGAKSSGVTPSSAEAQQLAQKNELLATKVEFLENNTRLLLEDVDEKKAVIASLIKELSGQPPSSAAQALNSLLSTPASGGPPVPSTPSSKSSSLSLRLSSSSSQAQAQAMSVAAQDAAAIARLQVLLQEQVGNNARLRKDLGKLGEEVASLQRDLSAARLESDRLRQALGRSQSGSSETSQGKIIGGEAGPDGSDDKTGQSGVLSPASSTSSPPTSAAAAAILSEEGERGTTSPASAKTEAAQGIGQASAQQDSGESKDVEDGSSTRGKPPFDSEITNNTGEGNVDDGDDDGDDDRDIKRWSTQVAHQHSPTARSSTIAAAASFSITSSSLPAEQTETERRRAALRAALAGDDDEINPFASRSNEGGLP